VRRLQHELEIHQIELEMQNDELRAHHAALEAGLQRYTDLYDFAPIGYFNLTSDGRIKLVNLNGAKLLGGERQQLMGRSFPAFIPESDRAAFAFFLRQVFATGVRQVCDLGLVAKDGRPLQARLKAMLSPEGTECLLAVLDITESQRLETALRQSEKLRTRAEALGQVGGWEFDVATRQLTWTETVYRIHELDPARQPTVQEGIDFYTPESRPTIELAVKRAIQLGESFDVELEIITAKGNRRHVHAIGHADLALGKVFGFFQDITQHKLAEKWLVEAKRFLQSTFDALALHIAILDEQGTIIQVNAAWSRFARENDFQDGDGLGANYLRVCQSASGKFSEGATDVAGGIADVIAGKCSEFSHEYPCPNPRQARWFVLQATRFVIAGSVRVVVAHENITERKRAEIALRDSREELRALTARIQVAREEERTRVAREIHDVLAQEITGIKMDLAWLRRRLAEPVSTSQRKILLKKIGTMMRLTDQASKSAQKIATDLRPVVLDSLGFCAAMVWVAADFQKRTEISCEAKVTNQDLALERDHSTALYRILQESLTNIVRHAAATRVEIGLGQEAGDLVLTIRDNGRGIRAEQLKHPQSLGLLGMSERAILLGGRCTIRPLAGGGTLVEARLPLAAKATPVNSQELDLHHPLEYSL